MAVAISGKIMYHTRFQTSMKVLAHRAIRRGGCIVVWESNPMLGPESPREASPQAYRWCGKDLRRCTGISSPIELSLLQAETIFFSSVCCQRRRPEASPPPCFIFSVNLHHLLCSPPPLSAHHKTTTSAPSSSEETPPRLHLLLLWSPSSSSPPSIAVQTPIQALHISVLPWPPARLAIHPSRRKSRTVAGIAIREDQISRPGSKL